MCCYSIAFSFQSLLSVFYKFSFFISIVVNISSYIRLWVGYLNYLYHFIVENVFRDTLFLDGKKIKWTFVNSSLQIILHRRKRRVKTIFMMKSTLYLFGQFSSIRTLPRNIGLRILLWREEGPVLRRLFIFFLARTAHGVFQLLDSINFHVQKLNDNITHRRRLISLYPECIFFLGRCTSSSGKFANLSYRAFSGTESNKER